MELRKGKRGVIKNFVWNLRSGDAASFVASPNHGASLTFADTPELVKNMPPTRSRLTTRPVHAWW